MNCLSNFGMPESSFRFQRFSIADDRCGMKVGTDAVLLGAWANVRDAKRILDIGTGSGIIALMLAQRSERWNAKIDAIDVEENAAFQAAENFAASPWSNRLRSTHRSLQQQLDVDFPMPYDLCVCNPPYFGNSQPATNPKKQLARQGTSLTAQRLFEAADKLLVARGRICLVLPFEQFSSTLQVATDAQFSLVRQTSVRSTASADAKRVLLEFSRHGDGDEMVPDCDELVIERARHDFTPEYAALTKEFHLRYADS